MLRKTSVLKATDTTDLPRYQILFYLAAVYKVWAHETLKSLIIPLQWTPLLKASVNVTEFSKTSVLTISLVSHVLLFAKVALYLLWNDK